MGNNISYRGVSTEYVSIPLDEKLNKAEYTIKRIYYVLYVLSAYNFPIRVHMVHGKIHERTGKTLVKPQVVPPFHRHHVTKPLKIYHNTIVIFQANTSK